MMAILAQALANGEIGGLRVVWITPIRALSKEIEAATQRALLGLEHPWRAAIRTGDTTAKQRAELKKNMPEILITTPESLHILLASKGYDKVFSKLQYMVVDEWHELIGSKRGVHVELALSRLRALNPNLQTWGISATIGNMEEALQVLLGVSENQSSVFIKSDAEKKYEVISILPDEVETLPWAGHLGIKMLEKVLPIIAKSKSTLIFTNTRSQAEIWYQRLLEVAPELSGLLAMHHGSISKDLRSWVEDALYDGRLKAVVCTSSLDLGVDFRPVETIIQIGSPKGVARFMQRAGRSGHRPGQVSRVYFVPTHSLELLEAAALRTAIERGVVEARMPYLRSIDVLVQYLVTLAVSDGFYPNEIYREVTRTFCYQTLSHDEWAWCLNYITKGGTALSGYEDFHKVEVEEDGRFVVNSRKVAMRHRLSMGTIVSDTMMRVKFVSGGFLGSIEEWFISKLKPGDVIWFAGRNLEYVRTKGLDVQVKTSQKKTGIVPSWMGGRMPLSAQLGAMLRSTFNNAALGRDFSLEVQLIQPLLKLQSERSIIPKENQFLLEKVNTREGCHLFCFPFEGRLVHEGMAALLAYRLSLFKRITFSIAMNDYGFELLSDADIPIEEALDSDVFTLKDLREDIHQSVNETEMARRRFREIAAISGMVFNGYPGKPVKEKHLQSSAQLIFNVLENYEPESLLIRQAYDEVRDFQLEEGRLRQALERINGQDISLVYPEKPTPLAFPIMVDRLRERFSNETLQERVQKMQRQFD